MGRIVLLQALDEYVWNLLRSVSTDLDAVRAAKQRTTAAQLGISALDPMDELDSIPHRIRFINRLAKQVYFVNAFESFSRISSMIRVVSINNLSRI